jgi:hypothetical protein
MPAPAPISFAVPTAQPTKLTDLVTGVVNPPLVASPELDPGSKIASDRGKDSRTEPTEARPLRFDRPGTRTAEGQSGEAWSENWSDEGWSNENWSNETGPAAAYDILPQRRWAFRRSASGRHRLR